MIDFKIHNKVNLELQVFQKLDRVSYGQMYVKCISVIVKIWYLQNKS